MLAFGVRLLPWHSVFWSGGAYPAGNDAYYHLRRIAFSVERFPEFLHFDRYLNFPTGARAIWTPVFDGLLAALGRLFVGPGRPELLEHSMLFVPPLLGAATAVATLALGRRFFARREALLAALLVALLPAAGFYSQLGFLDHHAAVALAGTGLLAAGLACAERWTTSRALALGGAAACALLLWPGCLLHVALALGSLSLMALFERDAERGARSLRFAALASLVGALLVAPLALRGAWEWERWEPTSPLVLGAFQPLFLLGSAAWQAAVAFVLPRIDASPDRPGLPMRRTASVLLASAAIAGLLLSATPLGEGARDAASWLGTQERFQATVVESEPLFIRKGEPSTRDAEEMYTRAVYAFPLVLGWLWWRRRRSQPAAGTQPRSERHTDTFWLTWTTVFAVAAIAQFRFANSFAVAYALVMARAACLGWDRWLAPLGAETPGRRASAQRWVALGAVGLATLYLSAPAFHTYRQHLDNLVLRARGEDAPFRGIARSHPLLVHVAGWIRANTPPTSGWHDPAVQPEYSVLANWSDGHLLRLRARRPMVQDNFGDDTAPRNVELAERYFAATSEAAALESIEPLLVHYVVVRAGGSGFSGAYAPGTLFDRLLYGRGAAAGDAPALAHHRLRYETPAWAGFAGERPAGVQVYEIVRGARVVGPAPPNTEVRARLDLEVVLRNGREPFHWAAHTLADSRGCYAIDVPYPSEPEPGNVRPTGLLELSSAGAQASLRVEADAVRAGRRLEGPSFAGPDRRAALRCR